MKDVRDSKNWLLLPPGDCCLLRFPHSVQLKDTIFASVRDLVAANYGAPFPWGWLPTPRVDDPLWHQHRLGVGGLFHTAWFVCAEGRIGGAPNTPEDLPGSLRSCLYLDGGHSGTGLAENEGYALIKSSTKTDQDMYRRVMLHAAKHIMADQGHLIITPISADGVVSVGFGGRCRTCPNPLLITIGQLRASVPEYRFELLPEWHGRSTT